MPERRLGDVLKSLREEQNISQDQLYQRTKILVKYIEALETGRWDLLPGQVYLKPFVKSIAEALGADYNDLSALIDKTEKATESEKEEPAESKGFDYRWLIIAVLIIIAALIIFLLRPVRTPENELEGDSTAALIIPEENHTLFERQYSSNLDMQKNIIEPGDIHTLEITATDSVWLMLTAGDDTMYVGILRPGRTLLRRSIEPFNLSMGRSNCVEVIFDSVAVDHDTYLKNKRRLDFSQIILNEENSAGE